MIYDNYNDYADDRTSEKIILCWIHASKRLINWSVYSGSVYVRNVDHFVIDVRSSNTSLTEGLSKALNQGEWIYYPEEGKLYCRMSDDSHPKTTENYISCIFRFFFSNAPIILPWDLDTGTDVKYEPRIDRVSQFNQEIDNALIGISMESQGNITLFNNDLYFSPIFDKLIFRNKEIHIFSWNRNLPLSEKKYLFLGEISDKVYNKETVRFDLVDFMFKLRLKLNLGLFEESMGSMKEDVLGQNRRRIYGKLDGVKCESLDAIAGQVNGIGTISGSAESDQLTGNGTSFLTDLSPEDLLILTISGEEESIQVKSVDSDTSLTLDSELDFAFAEIDYKIEYKYGYPGYNREWEICGHKLRQFSSTITSVQELNRFVVDDIEDLEADDIILINNTYYRRIRRIINSEKQIVLYQNLPVLPSVSDTVIKQPVSGVFFNGKSFVIDRDYTITNTDTKASIVFTDKAEMNVTREKQIDTTQASFLNGSRTITFSSGDIKIEFGDNYRSWIRSGDINHTTFYEIVNIISEIEIEIRTAYAGNDYDGDAFKKVPEYIQDESLIFVNCLGLEYDFGSGAEWVKRPAQVVKHLCLEAGITNLDTDSFDLAEELADYPVSIKFPETPLGELIEAKTAISKINQSCFANLTAKDDFTVSYKVLTPDRPSDLKELTDYDIDGFSVETKSEIFRRVISKYRHFDGGRYALEAGNSTISLSSDFVDNLVFSKEEKEIDIYLYNYDDALEITQRYLLYYSLTQSNLKIKGHLKISKFNLNDKIFVGFSSLYKRFGELLSARGMKIAIVNMVRRDGKTGEIEATDFSNLFNRVGVICDDTHPDFTTSTDEYTIIGAYICDDDIEIPSNDTQYEDCWNNNIIG